jgi:predicted transcriptional regulator
VDWDADTPLTDAEITEFAKEIVHKMIDNSDIAEDAYPDLRQRMHDAVERLDEYYPSEDERSE